MSRYDELAGDASEATARAEANPTVNNHRRAAGAHLVCAVHCAGVGWPDKQEMHDKLADEHIAAFKNLQQQEVA